MKLVKNKEETDLVKKHQVSDEKAAEAIETIIK